ncbi:MAG: hypothetical protein ACTSQ8_18825 [Candidatus Helarchaeota archaeon]
MNEKERKMIEKGKEEYEEMIKKLKEIGHFDEHENLTEEGKKYVLDLLGIKVDE